MFDKTLKNNEKRLRTVLADRPLVYLLGDAFAERYMNARKEAGIHLQSLRFSKGAADAPAHKDYKAYNKEVRHAPKEITLKASMLIWDDNVAIVDAQNKSAVLIENKEHAEVLKSWFDFIWSKSA